MSLEFVVDYAPTDHANRIHTFKLTIHLEDKGRGWERKVSRWLGAEAARDPRERIAREMLNDLYGGNAPLEDVAKACLVIKEAAARCA